MKKCLAVLGMCLFCFSSSVSADPAPRTPQESVDKAREDRRGELGMRVEALREKIQEQLGKKVEVDHLLFASKNPPGKDFALVVFRMTVPQSEDQIVGVLFLYDGVTWDILPTDFR